LKNIVFWGVATWGLLKPEVLEEGVVKMTFFIGLL
jgi:hypothetical protein